MSPRCLCTAHETARAARMARLPRWLRWTAWMSNPALPEAIRPYERVSCPGCGSETGLHPSWCGT